MEIEDHEEQPTTSNTSICMLENEHSLSINDHLYATMDSPRKLKKQLIVLTDKVVSTNKKLKVQRQRVRRLKKQVESLSSVVTSLRSKKFVSDSCLEMLENTYSGVSLAMMKRIVEHRGKVVTRIST